MIAIDLDSHSESRLQEIAQAQGTDAALLVRRLVVDFLDFQAMEGDTEEAWAESAVALAPDVMAPEQWDEGEHDTR